MKIRDADSRMVRNKVVYIALGVTWDGEREVQRTEAELKQVDRIARGRRAF